MTAVSTHLEHAAIGLAIAGGVCLFGCIAMLVRTGMAEGSGQPIPDDPSADVLTKIGRHVARSERRWVPAYQASWQVLLAVGLLLLLAAGWALVASLIGPVLAVVMILVALWLVVVIGTRASQKATTIQTPTGGSYSLVMVPQGVPVVSLLNRDKSWFRTPLLVVGNIRLHYGEWLVSTELAGGQSGTSHGSEVLSPRVEAAHRFRDLARQLRKGEFPPEAEAT